MGYGVSLGKYIYIPRSEIAVSILIEIVVPFFNFLRSLQISIVSVLIYTLTSSA